MDEKRAAAAAREAARVAGWSASQKLGAPLGQWLSELADAIEAQPELVCKHQSWKGWPSGERWCVDCGALGEVIEGGTMWVIPGRLEEQA